jgi:DNA-binding XRE family transcriptional regulator
MFRLQDRAALIVDVRNITLTLIEREDDTRS